MDGTNMYTLLFLLLFSMFAITHQVNIIFNCPDTRPSSTRPTSVHKLRPADIEVVGAMGDSITAGFAMRSSNLLDLFIEWRGLAFSVGGDKSLEEGVSTIPNILKKFNPNLYGYSRNQGFLGFPPAERNFNVALTGAESDDAMRQAKQLVSTMKISMGRFYYIHWKLITVYIGQNDHCDHCYTEGTEADVVKKYIDQMTEALDYLHDNIPRALVQIMGILNPTTFFLHPKVINNPVCYATHDFVCDCLQNRTLERRSNNVHDAMNIALRSLAASGRYDTTDDFTLVFQPTLIATDIPKKLNSDDYDMSYMGHDCFHPNYKLHTTISAAVWKSMLTPVTQKRPGNVIPSEQMTIACPSRENPYIATNRNS